jgi:hypothetical protein
MKMLKFNSQPNLHAEVRLAVSQTFGQGSEKIHFVVFAARAGLLLIIARAWTYCRRKGQDNDYGNAQPENSFPTYRVHKKFSV